MKNDGFDVERELRANRPEPRGDYTKALAGDVRTRGVTERTRAGRVGLALALSGLIVIALASFGGIGYASSAGSHAVKKPAVKHVRVVKSSAASAQYEPVKPPKPGNTTKPGHGTKPGHTTKPGHKSGAAGVKVQKTAPTSSQLPFTGLALWVPLAIGLMLVAVGLVLRTRGRRRHTGTV